MISLIHVDPCKKCKKHPYCPALFTVLNSRNIGQLMRVQEEFTWCHIKHAARVSKEGEMKVELQCDRLEEVP